MDDIYDDNKETIKNRIIQRFKGLEADVIIFINHTYKNEPLTDRKRALLYTALKRARFFLYCVHLRRVYRNKNRLTLRIK